MADIFISYSSHDRQQAEQLTEMLASAGLSCWIDKQGIDAATSWSGEIVDAIECCKAFLVLLSPSSVESVNVIKEVSLAAEQKKKILPLDLEPVALPRDLKYHLAGIQRTSMTNIDSIIRALGKLGLEATGAPQPPKIARETDGRKSLIILPFEDLSPTQDNQWFADGLAGELIDALGHIKSLRILDRKTSIGLRGVKQTTVELGKLFDTRYVIEGSVRKFGDQIKISCSLLDLETGDHLWQESYKGVMNDVFELQESVAKNVVEGLKLHLTQEEKSRLEEWGTENAEAYELYVKAGEYSERETKEGYELAVQLVTEAIALDPGYANPYRLKANALTELYRIYDRTPALLAEAETLAKEALRLKPDLYRAYYSLSVVNMHRGRLAEAEELAMEFIRKEPDNYLSHFALGFFYGNTGQRAKAIAPFEEAARLKPDNLASNLNLALACDVAGENERCAAAAERALPHFERHLKLHPDDESMSVNHAALLFLAGRTDAAMRAALELKERVRDGRSLYNAACLFAMLGDKPLALATCRKAIESGFRGIRHLKEFLTDEKDGVPSLRGTPEYEELERMVEAIEAEKKNG